jgi:hypothetical protein
MMVAKQIFIWTQKCKLGCYTTLQPNVYLFDLMSTPSVLKYKAFNGSKFVPKYKAS